MDAFYASVELLRRPELKHLPVAIGGSGDPTRRGVLTTANYVARQFGLKSGMPTRTALKLCPQAVFLPVDFAEYRRMSRLFKAALLVLCPHMEDRGIDEVYLDLRDQQAPSIEIAKTFQLAVFEATGLTCSIGIAHNKLLAKIASDLDKPQGISILGPGDLEARLWPLSAAKVPGIGPKAYVKLQSLGLNSIGDVAQAPPELLQQHFTPNYAQWLLDATHGRTHSPVEVEQQRKSYSRETTFEIDIDNEHDCARVLAKLSRLLQQDLRAKQFVGRTIGVKVRFSDFTTITRDRSLATGTNEAKIIFDAAWECFDRVPRRLGMQKVRLLGIRLGNLEEAAAQTPQQSAQMALALDAPSAA
jgi:DNA polymerase IV